MTAPIGTYNPPHTRHERPGRVGAFMVQPLADKDGGIANAHYVYEGPDGDGLHFRYRLARIDEWMPPMSPQEKAEQFTDAMRLPPMRADGSVDYEALAARRRKEWAESR